MRLLVIASLFAVASLASAHGASEELGLAIDFIFDSAELSLSPISAVLTLEFEGKAEGPLNSLALREPIQTEVKVPGNARIQLPVAGTWRAHLVAEGFWCKETQFRFPGDPSEASLRLFPTGELRGRMETSDQKPLPDHLDITFADVGSYLLSEEEVPEGMVRCPLSGDAFKCSIPAGELDMNLVADGYARAYLWDVKITPRAERNVGTLSLVAGGSVVGWVVDDQGSPLKGAKVQGELAIERPAEDLLAMHRLARMGYGTTTNEQGFFQLTGIAPGMYRVSVTQEGFAPTLAGESISIRGDITRELSEPLVLRSYVTLDLTLEPPLDLTGKPWHVSVSRAHAKGAAEGFDREVSQIAEGRWQKPKMVPGDYYLVVTASDDSRWLAEEIELNAGQEALFFKIPVLEVRGSVMMGGDPVSGALWLECDTRVRSRFEVDEEGAFSGSLAKEGRCRGELRPSEKDMTLVLRPVEVRKDEGESFAIIELEIPDTRLAGEVVDSLGRPVSEAKVSFFASRSPVGGGYSSSDRKIPLKGSEVPSDDQGTFEIWGLPPGRLVVQAEKGQEASDLFPIDLSEGRTAPNIRLVLHESTEISGWVYSPRGPVPGAFVAVWGAISASNLGGEVSYATSDVDGSFWFEIRSDVRIVDVIVEAPGYGTRIVHETIDQGQPLILEVDMNGGDLALEVPEQEHGLALFHQQTFVPFSLLGLLAGGRATGRLELPNVEGGEYIFCAGVGDWSLAVAASRAAPGQQCVAGLLSPGGSLVLSLTEVKGEPSSAPENP